MIRETFLNSIADKQERMLLGRVISAARTGMTDAAVILICQQIEAHLAHGGSN